MNREERMKKDGLVEEPIDYSGAKKSEATGYLSNFSPHSIWLPHPFNGEIIRYATGEHRYQAMKADNIDEHDWVNESSGPGESKSRGRQVDLRPGWDDGLGYYVMVEIVRAKALTHGEILKKLLKTEGRALWEDSPTDDIWGIRYRDDYRGKNLLGKAWMQVRDEIYLTVREVGEIVFS